MGKQSLVPCFVLLMQLSIAVTALAKTEVISDGRSPSQKFDNMPRMTQDSNAHPSLRRVLIESRPCKDNLQLSDGDDSGSINRAEYATFISAQSCGGKSGTFGGLGLQYVSPFYSVACAACHKVTGDPTCCYGNNPSIILNDESMSFICDSLSDVIGTCAPSSSPSSVPSSPTTSAPTQAPVVTTTAPSVSSATGSQQEAAAAEAGGLEGDGNRGGDDGGSTQIKTFPLLILILAIVAFVVMVGVFIKRRADKRRADSRFSSVGERGEQSSASSSSEFDSPPFSPKDEDIEITPDDAGVEDDSFTNASHSGAMLYPSASPRSDESVSESYSTTNTNNERAIQKSGSMFDDLDYFMDCGGADNVEMEFYEDD